jgi:hypothetical protein
MSQLIDLTAAKEFMKETLDRVNRDELVSIASDLEAKSKRFQELLHADRIHQLENEHVEEILRSVFATRRRYKQLLEANPHESMKGHMKDLLYGNDKVEERFQKFVDNLTGLDDNLRSDLAGEILHFTHPEQYWLWGRWMWDPQKRTGAIPLVTTEEFDLQGQTEGEIYLKVGKGIAFVHSIADAADFQFISRTLFGTDVFLSCVYVVYAYTVLRLRMTQEFNKVMPGLPEFSRRLLGVYKVPQAVA